MKHSFRFILPFLLLVGVFSSARQALTTPKEWRCQLSKGTQFEWITTDRVDTLRTCSLQSAQMTSLTAIQQ